MSLENKTYMVSTLSYALHGGSTNCYITDIYKANSIVIIVVVVIVRRFFV